MRNARFFNLVHIRWSCVLARSWRVEYSAQVHKFIGVGLLVSSCVTLVPRDGFELQEKWWLRDQQTLRSQASFDLECPPESLTLQVVTTLDTVFAEVVVVSGCGKRAAYSREPRVGTLPDDDSKWRLRPEP